MDLKESLHLMMQENVANATCQAATAQERGSVSFVHGMSAKNWTVGLQVSHEDPSMTQSVVPTKQSICLKLQQLWRFALQWSVPRRLTVFENHEEKCLAFFKKIVLNFDGQAVGGAVMKVI
ncbi:hypothetical protein HELRODRAFT_172492 [Helobdella robusta]|uniref:Uncharacterized protein n=1 Tax=Helobdella robusta TaxID=6412 RepID=T1F5E4_HELRO|nr:hypothetical protein HELRODRAFT_172492 [Helobdella robusta]ESO04817.1 hypothetical protein HELRODRAFT_172492 [Helobdella robusta]